MSRKLSNLISIIFHPIFVNFLNLWLLFTLFPALHYGIPQRMQYFYISFIFLATSIIPLIMVIMMRFTGKVKSVLLTDKEDRKLPYLVTLIVYFFCYYYFTKLHTHPLILSYLVSCAAIVGLVLSINFFDKISIHTATLGAMAGLLAVAGKYTSLDIRYFLILTFLVSGLVASARIISNSHQNIQVYSGFLLGFLLMFFIL
ncbi:MAG: hypothetical protein Q8M15_06715 [Bacteroidota bacterium]|nr:hypothetical protein [Bacteroidota bacterium]